MADAIRAGRLREILADVDPEALVVMVFRSGGTIAHPVVETATAPYLPVTERYGQCGFTEPGAELAVVLWPGE